MTDEYQGVTAVLSAEIPPRDLVLIKAALFALSGRECRVLSVKQLAQTDAPAEWVNQGRIAVMGSHNEQALR